MAPEKKAGTLTRLERKEDMLDEGQNPVVLHIAWLTKSFLQLLLHILLPIKEVDFRLLEVMRKETSCG